MSTRGTSQIISVSDFTNALVAAPEAGFNMTKGLNVLPSGYVHGQLRTYGRSAYNRASQIPDFQGQS